VAGRKTAAAQAASKLEQKPVRSRFAEDLASHYPDVAELLRQAGQATKKVSIIDPCAKCGCTHSRQVEVPDARAAIQVAEFLANQGLGRPGEDQSGKSGSRDFVVQRYVVEPEEES
jgi:hypothetical protein